MRPNLVILTGILDHFFHATTLEAKRVGVELALDRVHLCAQTYSVQIVLPHATVL